MAVVVSGSRGKPAAQLPSGHMISGTSLHGCASVSHLCRGENGRTPSPAAEPGSTALCVKDPTVLLLPTLAASIALGPTRLRREARGPAGRSALAAQAAHEAYARLGDGEAGAEGQGAGEQG